jgi:hypothetical protein
MPVMRVAGRGLSEFDKQERRDGGPEIDGHKGAAIAFRRHLIASEHIAQRSRAVIGKPQREQAWSCTLASWPRSWPANSPITYLR